MVNALLYIFHIKYLNPLKSKKNLKIKGILFDMDGTVLDSEALFEEGQVLLLEEYNVKEED